MALRAWSGRLPLSLAPSADGTPAGRVEAVFTVQRQVLLPSVGQRHAAEIVFTLKRPAKSPA